MTSVKISHLVGKYPVLSESWLREKILRQFETRSTKVFSSLYAMGKGELFFDGDIIQPVFVSIPSNKVLRCAEGFLKLTNTFLSSPKDFLLLVSGYRGDYRRLIFVDSHFLPLFRKILKSSDLVHCHFGMIANKFLRIERCLEYRPLIVVSFYGQDVERYPKIRGDNYYEYLKDRVQSVFAMTEFMKNRLEKQGFDGNKIYVVNPGVNLNKYTYKQVIRKNGEPFKIISIGRIVKKKGFDDLLRSVGEVYKSKKNISVKIVGPTSSENQQLERELLALRHELGLDNIVEFCGAVAHDDILGLMHQSHLMVQLSKTDEESDTEGLPYVILEGQAAGLPVVSTRHAGIPEAIVDGVNGFLVDESDYMAAAQRINGLIEDGDRLSLMSKNAREQIEKKFSLDVCVSKELELYKKLIYEK